MVTKNGDAGEETPRATLSRDEVRAKVFASRKPKSLTITFFGVELELRQPTYGEIASVRQNENREAGIIDTLVHQAYIPGTEIQPFDDADAEAFKAMPFGSDFIAVANALTELTEVNFQDKKPS